MPQECLPAGCTKLARVFAIDECTDIPTPGASNGYWLDCFRNVTWEPNVEEGASTVLQDDCGRTCWKNTECDDLTEYTISFEALNPDYELEALLTGWPVIVDGLGNTIGINRDESLDCQPWLGLELFEEVPRDACEDGFELRRIVFKVRFQPPGNAREDQFRINPWTAKSTPFSPAAYGTGPWDDSGVDFSGADPDQRSHVLEYFDTGIDIDSLEGQCGYVEVPVPV